VKLLSLSRRDLESKIGRLSDIIEADVQKEVSFYYTKVRFTLLSVRPVHSMLKCTAAIIQ
jgi:hypothetical protein